MIDRNQLAETIAKAFEHERYDDDTVECPNAGTSMGCTHEGGHPPIPCCDTCGENEWPCAPALAAADAVLAVLSGQVPAVEPAAPIEKHADEEVCFFCATAEELAASLAAPDSVVMTLPPGACPYFTGEKTRG